jgi:hypothetical protein
MRKPFSLKKPLLMIILLLLIGLISISSRTTSLANNTKLRLGEQCTTSSQCRNNLECVKPVGAFDSRCAFKVKTACLNTSCIGRPAGTSTVPSGSSCLNQEASPKCNQCYNGVHFVSESSICIKKEEQKCKIYPKKHNPKKIQSNCEIGTTCIITGSKSLGRRCVTRNAGSLCSPTEPCNDGNVCIMVDRKNKIRRCHNGQVNSACNNSYQCNQGLTCDPSTSRCKSNGEINQFCDSQNTCKAGLKCDPTLSLCKTSGEANQFCNAENACKPGFICSSRNFCEDENNLTKVRVKVLNYFDGHNGHPNLSIDNVKLFIEALQESLEQSAQYKKYINPSAIIPSALNITITENLFFNNTPPQKGVNCEQYLPLVKSGQWRTIDWQTTNCWGSGTADYVKILDDNNVCADINNNLYDEVWIIGFGSAGFWEARMTGVGAFHTNGPVLSGTQIQCNRPVHIMGLNYQPLVVGNVDNPSAFALHSFGHRFESTMRFFLLQEFLRFNRNESKYSWAYGAQHPLDLNSNPSCGNIHWPPNAQSHYDYTNTASINSDCIDWNVNETGQKAPIDCSTWGCSQLGFMKWWMQNIPGVNNNLTKVDGSPMPNWWSEYLFRIN